MSGTDLLGHENPYYTNKRIFFRQTALFEQKNPDKIQNRNISFKVW